MRFSDLNKDEFKVNVESGHEDSKLAKLYGVSSRTIMRWRHSLGLSSHWEPDRSDCGTFAAYCRGCRCDDCRKANRDRHAQVVEKMRSEGLPEDDKRHGTYTAYTQWGCRCDPCRRVNSERSRARYVEDHGEPDPNHFWKPEDDVALMSLSPTDAAQALGKSLSAVYGRRHRLKAKS